MNSIVSRTTIFIASNARSKKGEDLLGTRTKGCLPSYTEWNVGTACAPLPWGKTLGIGPHLRPQADVRRRCPDPFPE